MELLGYLRSRLKGQMASLYFWDISIIKIDQKFAIDFPVVSAQR
jgi:hypothetical protein